MGRKVFVIGLDAATFDIISPMVERGELPTFKKLMDEGSWGNLESTIPYLTPPAWTSSLTGVNPGKHNVFDFFKRNDNSIQPVPVNAKDRKLPMIWSLASNQGKTTGIFNVPITYPPDKIDGFMISGMGTPKSAQNYIEPRELKMQLEKAFPFLKEGPKCLSIDCRFLIDGDEDGFLQNLYEVTDRQEKIFSKLYQDYKPDFFMFVFDDLDRLQHFFWRYLDETHSLYEASAPSYLKAAIPNYYKRIDSSIKNILSLLDDNTTVIIYSDHGFGALEKDVYINQFLKKHRLLKTKAEREFKILVKKTLNPILNNRFTIWEGDADRIDPGRTIAYFDSLSGQNIKIIRQNCTATSYEEICSRLIKLLLNIKDPNTGQNIIRKVHRREDIYHGPCVENAPDLVIECEERYCLQTGFNKNIVSKAQQYGIVRSGDHRRNGMFICWGPNIRHNANCSLSIFDMMPTMMYILGLEIPRYVDGKVATEIFDVDFLGSHPIKFTDDTFDTYTYEGHDYTKEEAKEITDKLKGLGYL